MAIVSAAIGALGAGVPTLVVSHNQIVAAEDAARQSLAREQRHEAYTKLKDAVVTLQAHEQKCVDVVAESKGFAWVPATVQEIEEIHDDIREAYDEVREAADHVNSSVAAPDEVVRLAEELVRRQSETVQIMLRTSSESYARQDSSLDPVRTRMRSSYEAYERFSRAVGMELRSG
ncbi:hypothetical protein [Pseudonocardia kunmingensis]|uniref:hypothetical protein n=1 Tax=Pseudonocardia kunmingensis TaxID=630975 RepID=UPI00115398D0|nr:hypothetical protein [Pseudonocardia kunmingensis]